MDSELEKAYLQIMQARLAEDLFGAKDVVLAPSRLLEHLEVKRAPLVRVTEASLYHGEDREAALEARQRLEELWADLLLRVPQQLYALPGYEQTRAFTSSKTFRVGENTYLLGTKLEENSELALYQGYVEKFGTYLGQVMFKVAKSPKNNHLIEKEYRILETLHETEVPQWKHLPIVLDRFQSQGRSGVVLRMISGHSLTWLKSRPQHQKGLDQRDMIWMFDRVLSCLGYVHRCGIVHGVITPAHLIVQHLSHNVILTGWGTAVQRPAISGEVVETYLEPWSAPEVLEKGHIGPWSDIYSLGKVMIWLLGGDPYRNEIPQGVITPLKKILLRMVQEDIEKRASNAWELWQEQELSKVAYGERKFRALDVT